MACANPKRSKSNGKSRAACTEENELLSGTSMKMTDAPFGGGRSSDSDEDDMLEDYDEGVSFRTPCLQGRTYLEKFLIVLLLVCLAVIVGLAVGLTRPQIIPVTKYCNTSSCVRAASSLISSIDWSVDPCTNFYQFACGHWLKTNPIPPGYHQWDRFHELSGQNLYVLSQLIGPDSEDTSSPQGGSYEKVRMFYQSCMSSTEVPRSQILEAMSALIDYIGGGGNHSNQDSLNDWDYMVALEKVHKLGAWPFFKLSVEVDEREPTRRNIIKIDLGEKALPSILTPGDVDISGINGSVSEAIKDYMGLKSLYLEETTHIYLSLGDSKEEAEEKAKRMFKIEDYISKISYGYNHIHDKFSLYNIMTVDELEYNFTIVNWVQYLIVLGFDVESDTEVVVMYPEYMAKITEFFKGMYSAPAERKRDLKDYLALSLLRSFKPYFEKELFDIRESAQDTLEEPWKRCTFYTNKAMGFATGALYVKSTGSEDSVKHMERIITYVKIAFKDHLLRKFWMDKGTRKKAEKKVDAIIDKISYPSFILNNTFLDNYYKNLSVVADDWLANLKSWRLFLMSDMNAELMKKPDRKSSWLRPPVTVNAFYSPTRNEVIFPIAIFNLPFYIPEGPGAVNFGAIGSIIGHEITHAFDIQGRQYDGQGKLSDWWDHRTAESFAETTKCMKDQYSNISVKGVPIDGEFTLDENIADNGGLRAAMYAYQMYLEDFGEELQLPGINLTAYQAFYTSYAQMYCSKYTHLAMYYHLLTDPHSPGSARVNAVLSNSETFYWAFQCQRPCKMCPATRCQVW